MSTTIDQKVVEMRFDNSHFEKNVSSTMSTLDKLKQKLHLDGASKGLDNLSASAKKVDMSSLGNSVDNVRSRFSAMEVMGVTALANITNSAVNAGKRIVASLTIDPVKTGFNEYELKMDSVKTIMASTGESIETVNGYLEELNEYSDQTIYSFSDMTQNIGKFTNAGVKLEDAVLAIKGISNEAAVSGANANEASRAMYNFAQALSAGYVKLIDWKSIELANMATVEFKNELINTAVELGTLSKQGDKYVSTTADMNGSVSAAFDATSNFNESLSAQWMTTDVLVKTLGRYADENTEIGKKAFAAAQDVTKFTQMLDVLKETAQSGWAKTWEIIFGDIDKAKAVFTPLTNFFGGIIDKISDARNKLLEGALGGDSLVNLEKFEKCKDTISDATAKVEKFQKVVTDVWRGDYGNGVDRMFALKEAGHNYHVIQSLVNKGIDYKITLEDIEKAQKTYAVELSKTSDETEKLTVKIEDLSDEQLKSIGYTEEEIATIRKLAKEAEKAGVPLAEFIKGVEKVDGRTLLIESFKNAGQGLVAIITAIKDAWFEVFPPMTSEQLYNIIAAIHKFSEKLVVGDETADKLRRTLKGVFAVLDIITTILGGAFKVVFKIVTALLSAFDLDILTVTAHIGDALVGLRDWIDKILDFSGAVNKVLPYLKSFVNGIKKWFKGLKEADNIPKYIFEGLIKGIKNGATNVWDAIVNLGQTILDKIKDVLGIHSPSVEFFKIGENIIQGLVNGVKSGASTVWETVKNLGSKCIEVINDIGIEKIFVGGLMVGIVSSLSKFANAFAGFGQAAEGVGDMCEDIGRGFKNIGKGVKNYLNSAGMLNMAIAIGILALAVYKLAELDAGKLWGAIGALTVLGIVMVALSFAVSKIGSLNSFSISPKVIFSIVAVGGALLLLALAMTKIASIDSGNVGKVLLGLFGMVAGLMAIVQVCKGKDNAFVKMGGTLIAASVALLLMVGIIKLVSGLSIGEITKGLIVIAALELLIMGLIKTCKGKGGDAKVKMGGTLMAVSITLLLMVGIIALVSKLSAGDIAKGLIVIAALELLIMGLIKVCKGKGGDARVKMGGTLLAVSITLLIMVGIIKLVAGLSVSEITKGLVVIAVLELLIIGLIAVCKQSGDGKSVKAAGTLLAAAAAILILAGVMILLTFVDTAALYSSLGVVAVLGALMIGLLAASKNAQKCTGSLIALTILIALLVAVVVGLTYLDSSELYSSVGALSILMVALGALVKSLGSLKNAKTIWKSVLPIILLVATLGLVLAMMSALDTSNAIVNAAALSILLIVMTAMLDKLSEIGRRSKSMKNSIIALTGMTVSLALMGLVLAMMSALDTSNAIVNAAALSILLLVMTTALGMLSKTKKVSTNSIVALTAMNAALALMALVLAMMSGLNTNNAITNATALSMLLIVMSGALVLLSLIGPMAKNALKGVLALAAMAVPLALMGLVLAMMSAMNVQGAMESASALSLLLVTMSATLILLSVVGALGPAAFIGIGALATLIVAVGALIMAIGALVTEFPMLEEFLDVGIPIIEKIGTAIGSFFGNIIGGLIGGISDGLPKVGENLSAFMAAAQPFIDGCKQVDGSVLAGIGILAGAVLAFTAVDLLTGIASFMSGGSSFVQLGTELSTFMTNAMPFIAGAKMVDSTVMDAVSSLAKIILTLTAANLLDGLTSWFTGGSSLGEFSAQLPELGTHLASFVTNLGSFGEAQVTTVTCASNAIVKLAEAADSIPNQGGWLAAIVGDNTISSFGAQLPELGTHLASFVANLGEFTDGQLATVTCAADAIVTLAKAADQIPNQGGWLAGIVGDNTISTFGGQLPGLGTNLSEFATNLGTFKDGQAETVTCAADAIVSLAKAADQIPNQGGWLAAIVGDNTISTFGAQLPELGTNLSGFATNLGTFTDAQVTTVTCAANAIKAMAEAADNIPNEGGWLKAIVGDNSIATFGSYLPGLGTNLSEFATNLGTFDDAKVATVTCAANAIKAMAGAAKNIDGQADWAKKIFGDNSLATFGDELANLGSDLNTFAQNLGAFDDTKVATVDCAVNAINKITNISGKNMQSANDNLDTLGDNLIQIAKDFKTFINDMPTDDKIAKAIRSLETAIAEIEAIASSNTDVATKFIDSLKNLATDAIGAFKNVFSSSKSKSDVKKAAVELMDKVEDGIESNEKDIKKAATSLVSTAVSEMKTETLYDKFVGAGKYFVEGFAAGIDANTFKAEAKAAAMAKAAAKAAEEALDINSPSKVGYGIGGFFGLGFVNALGDYAEQSYIGGSEIADSARSGLSDAINNVGNILGGDMDLQPTIRPVIDLSDVRAGASAIGSLLGVDSTVGVLANVGVISSSMSNQGQNGVGSDLLDAINKLRRDIGNMHGDTYTINGVTYDDGSNISDAVKTIVRAARVERRI